MKYALFIGALMAASSCFAQNKDPLYNFDNTSNPKVVRTLGTNPEFPCLQNKTTPEQVLGAMRKVDRTEGRQKQKMDALLQGAGFESGISDVKLSNISLVTLPDGTTGNMGNGGYNSSYTQLSGNENGYRAWKITADNGSSVYFMAKCGNSFAVNNMDTKNTTACKTMPVSITSDPKTISSGDVAVKERVEQKETYIYYHKRGKKVKYANDEERIAAAAIPDSHPSDPLLLRSVKKAHFIPQEYKVTVTPQNDKVTVCDNKPVDVAANINVEYTSEYTGNYPASSKTYVKVSKHVYKKSMRKMRRADRKERKVTKMTGVDVNK